MDADGQGSMWLHAASHAQRVSVSDHHADHPASIVNNTAMHVPYSRSVKVKLCKLSSCQAIDICAIAGRQTGEHCGQEHMTNMPMHQ